MCCYADDSTYTVAGKTAEELTEKLSLKYAVLADFLTDNKLKVNDDKTHLLVMTSRQKMRLIKLRETVGGRGSPGHEMGRTHTKE